MIKKCKENNRSIWRRELENMIFKYFVYCQILEVCFEFLYKTTIKSKGCFYYKHLKNCKWSSLKFLKREKKFHKIFLNVLFCNFVLFIYTALWRNYCEVFLEMFSGAKINLMHLYFAWRFLSIKSLKFKPFKIMFI